MEVAKLVFFLLTRIRTGVQVAK